MKKITKTRTRRNSSGSCKTLREETGSWLWSRCYQCGHRLAFASTGCPQCGIDFDGRKMPKRWPEKCDCERCTDAKRRHRVGPHR
jgi:hypothetical protein